MKDGVVRRVVTCQSADDKSKLVVDGLAPVALRVEGSATVVEVWKTTETPARLSAYSAIPAVGALSLTPPKNGSVFWIADIPSVKGDVSATESKAFFEQLGGADAATGGESRDAMMHRTETIDYGIVLEGEITLVIDGEDIHLKAGDVVVQCGANHAWSNRSNKICRMAFVMIDGIYSAA